jgi:hypothetical protein
VRVLVEMDAPEGRTVKRITRKNAKVDRIARPWLTRRFIDRHAEFLFAARARVLAVAD